MVKGTDTHTKTVFQLVFQNNLKNFNFEILDS